MKSRCNLLEKSKRFANIHNDEIKKVADLYKETEIKLLFLKYNIFLRIFNKDRYNKKVKFYSGVSSCCLNKAKALLKGKVC